MKTGKSPVLVVTILAAIALIAIPRAFARAPAHRAVAHPIPQPPSESAQIIFDHYIKIQTALAQDSLEGVAESAVTIAKAVRSDPARTFAFRVANRADLLARAKKLTQARAALVRLTFPLSEYAKKSHLAGFYEGWCPMQRTYWLQSGQTADNPYMGKAMPRCGWLRDMNGTWFSRGQRA